MFDDFVKDRAGLERICDRLRAERWIALDTEFVRERTYYARLSLIQIATPHRIVCIDPLAVPNLDVLLDVIYAERLLKVLHSARQDLEVFHDLRGAPPAPVFDTQIAAALAGNDEQIGYGALVQAVLCVKLAKLHTRTDWSARPLSDDQLRYAEDDVRYLRDLYKYFEQKLAALGRREWLTEECGRLTQSELYQNNPEQAHTRIKGGRALPPSGQNVMRAVATWRERSAQARDLPRNWVLRDAAIVELARQLPQSREQLEQINGLGRGTVKKWGEAILGAIAQGLAAPPALVNGDSNRLDAEQTRLYRAMVDIVDQRARELRISSALIATRRDLKSLVRGETNGALRAGWRRQVVGDELVAMLANVGT
ncbi:MAG: ribonuclease D [Acidiferrobacterales bacterium]